jgi:curved DNA-binding protein CbpA
MTQLYLHTHYDNLKVSRDAPVGVIKAAYKALAQENHPDKCKDANAPKRMQVINAAYEVLSDSVKRAEHDRWIKSNEKLPAPTPTTAPKPAHRPVSTPTPVSASQTHIDKLHAAYIAKIRAERQVHAAEVDGLKRAHRFDRGFGILLGIMIAIPLCVIFATIDNVVNHAHAQQYQEANMRRN